MCQVDHKKGFGGKFGVESDRVDKTAAGYSDAGSQPVGTNYQRTRAEPSSQGAKNLKSRFEDMAKSSEEEDRRRAKEERQRRKAREEKEKTEAAERAKVEESSDVYDEAAPAQATRLPSTAAVAQEEEEEDEDELYQDAGATRDDDQELYQDTTTPTQYHSQPQAEEQDDEELYQVWNLNILQPFYNQWPCPRLHWIIILLYYL